MNYCIAFFLLAVSHSMEDISKSQNMFSFLDNGWYNCALHNASRNPKIFFLNWFLKMIEKKFYRQKLKKY
jgi:GTP-dependent phosphoenolpyruvate carboxykinase